MHLCRQGDQRYAILVLECGKQMVHCVASNSVKLWA